MKKDRTLLLAILVYFIHDDSPRQERTRRLIDQAIDLVLPMAPLLGMPQIQPFREARGIAPRCRSGRGSCDRPMTGATMPAVNIGARTAWCLFAALALSCSSTAKERPYKSGDDPPILPAGTEPVAVKDEADAPEISRSVGSENGILVLWPRIVLSRSGPSKPDDETRAIAGRLQARIAELVRASAAGKAVEVRPEPERVCPRSGCKAMSVGVLLARAGKGCAATALISGPGTAPARIVPWLGSITASRNSVPFREPPESAIDVKDYLSCADVAAAVGADADVTKAIAEVR